MSPGRYRSIVSDALGLASHGPYTFAELLEVYDVMTDEFCGERGSGCSRDELLDWLLAIGPQGQQRLLDDISRSREEERSRTVVESASHCGTRGESLCRWAP